VKIATMILQIKDAQRHKLGALALNSNNDLWLHLRNLWCGYCTCQTTLSYHIIIEVLKMNILNMLIKVHMIQFNVWTTFQSFNHFLMFEALFEICKNTDQKPHWLNNIFILQECQKLKSCKYYLTDYYFFILLFVSFQIMRKLICMMSLKKLKFMVY
jgi:hypothetical protein